MGEQSLLHGQEREIKWDVTCTVVDEANANFLPLKFRSSGELPDIFLKKLNQQAQQRRVGSR